MAYLPLPEPVPTIDDRPFWEHCRKRELRFQRCRGCGGFRHPPRPACPRCQSFDAVWEAVHDTPELFSFTVVHHPAHESVRDAVPYNVAIVRFASADDVRLISNVTDAQPQDLRIGMPLELHWEERGSLILPRFRAPR